MGNSQHMTPNGHPKKTPGLGNPCVVRLDIKKKFISNSCGAFISTLVVSHSCLVAEPWLGTKTSDSYLRALPATLHWLFCYKTPPLVIGGHSLVYLEKPLESLGSESPLCHSLTV